MELLILFFPLLGFFFPLFFGYLFGSFFSCILSISFVLLSLFVSLVVFLKVSFTQSVFFYSIFSWIKFPFMLEWGLLFDSLTVVMLLVVLTISSIVHLYSFDYMGDDPHQPRFFSYLSLFTFFMLLLVTAPNFFQLFVGWEGVGVCSYLLISFWYTRKQASKAAIKAMIVNRVGDFGLLLAMGVIYYTFGSLDFAVIFALSSSSVCYYYSFLGFSFAVHSLIGFMLLLGAIGKSAQLGLHTWLPDAMEGPTPVSALIHAATMVTAGVFLLIRSSPLLEFSEPALAATALVGSLTAFFGATVGMLQNDLKRVIAYSTCSQLGYMVFACGISAYPVAVFHLYNHAFFKALLFLGAGAVIHAYGDEQDMRKMGGLHKLLPSIYSIFVIGCFSLSGFPFLTGFYSKDLILETTSSLYSSLAVFSNWLGLFSAFITAFYCVRLLYLTFLSTPRGGRYDYQLLGGVPSIMLGCLIFLALCSIFLGFFSRDLLVGFGTDFWNSSLYIAPFHFSPPQSEFVPTIYKLFPLFFSLFGAFFSFFFHFFIFSFFVSFSLEKVGKIMYNFFSRKWEFDLIQNTFFSFPTLRFGYEIGFRLLDRGIVEFFGPTGISKVVQKLVEIGKVGQTGYLFHYIFLIIFCFTFFLFFFLLNPTLLLVKFFLLLFLLSFFQIKKNIDKVV